MVYIVNYRLHKPQKDYDELYKAIESISGTYWHNTTSSWLVESELSASQVYDLLKPHIDSNDELVVFCLSGNYRGQLLRDDIKWLEGVMERA